MDGFSLIDWFGITKFSSFYEGEFKFILLILPLNLIIEGKNVKSIKLLIDSFTYIYAAYKPVWSRVNKSIY